ncbi:MAG: hypothetical protein IJ311_04625 [Elusimicrobiaceae bacterium]|nr:hypothetical protein [Elusimicrobiaceae bacterium]
MKFIIAMQTKLEAVKKAAFNCVKKQEGQNTIEYIIMLGVVVGIALLVGTLVKDMMPKVFESVKQKIIGGVSSAE